MTEKSVHKSNKNSSSAMEHKDDLNKSSAANDIAAMVRRRASSRLSPEQVVEKNEKLIRALRAMSGAMSIDTKQLSTILEIEYNQLNACYTGFRDFAYISPKQRLNIARFLNVSGLQVALWCGLITLEEFVSPQDIDSKLNQIFFSNVISDPEIAKIAPSEKEWNAASDHMRLAYSLLYQAYMQKWLIGRVMVDGKAMTDIEERARSAGKQMKSLPEMTAQEHFEHNVKAAISKKKGYTLSPVIKEKKNSTEMAESQEQIAAKRTGEQVTFTEEQVRNHMKMIESLKAKA